MCIIVYFSASIPAGPMRSTSPSIGRVGVNQSSAARPHCWQQKQRENHCIVLIKSSAPSLLNTKVTVLSEITAHTHKHTCIYELTQIHAERSTNPSLMSNIIIRSQLKEDQPSQLTQQSGCFRCLRLSVCLSVWDVVDECTVHSGNTEANMHIIHICC